MYTLKFKKVMFFMILTASINSHANEATQQCESVYKENITQYNYDSQLAVTIEQVAKNECNSDGTAVNVGYSDRSKSLLGGLTDKARDIFGSYSKTSDFCSAYKSGKLSTYTSSEYQSKPLKDLATQFNACMQIASNFNYAIWSVQNGPSETAFHGQFFVAGNSGVYFNVLATYNGAVCTTPINGRSIKYKSGTQMRVDNEFSLICRREGSSDKDSINYKSANILIFFNGQPYPITMTADKVFNDPGNGPKSSQEANNIILNLTNKLNESNSKITDQEKEITRLNNINHYTIFAYIGQDSKDFSGARVIENEVPDKKEPAIIHFSCGFKDINGSRRDGRAPDDIPLMGDKLVNTICGGHEFGKWLFMGHNEGQQCGYDSFMISCAK